MSLNFGELFMLQRKASEAKDAFAELRGAIDTTAFSGSGDKFAAIIGALDKILSILKEIQKTSIGKEQATAGIEDVKALRSDVADGKLTTKSAVNDAVDAIIAKYKDAIPGGLE